MKKIEAFIEQERSTEPKKEGDYLVEITECDIPEINRLKIDTFSFNWKQEYNGIKQTLMPGFQYAQYVNKWYKKEEGYFISEEEFEEIKTSLIILRTLIKDDETNKNNNFLKFTKR